MIAKAFTVLLAVAGLANADLNFSKDEVTKDKTFEFL